MPSTHSQKAAPSEAAPRPEPNAPATGAIPTHPASARAKVRVRFAPSPTGYLHVGGVRSALFNWLWARHTGGTFVLRIEDTDRNRLVEGALDQIIATHDALGISPDEGPTQGGSHGPYIQSQRLSLYREHAEKLLQTGALYRCWCPPERLTKLREEAQAKGIAFKYDRHCLIPQNQGDLKAPHVLRFRIPDARAENPDAPESIAWEDAVRGRLEFKLADLDDFVAMKADGFPTYQFANVVDDHLMEISHVLRADEWIPSTPKHLLVYEAFGWQKPIFAHLPPIQGPTGGKKLSKRDGAQSVQEYLGEGYLPEALRSFLATLGWNDGTTDEVYDTATLIERFTLDRIQKSPARFDKEHLTWVNGVMIRQMPLEQLYERCEAFWPAEAAGASHDYKLSILPLIQERLKFLTELPELTTFFFADPDLTQAPAQPDPQLLTAAIDALKDSDFTAADLETRLRALTEKLGVKTGVLFSAIRLAITGKKAAPGLFETLHVLGKDVSLRRLRAATN